MKLRNILTTTVLAFLLTITSLSGADLDTLVQDREEKQASVWRLETLAQDYEEAFIRFWDALRTSEEPEAVFKAFSFNHLKTGDLSDPVTLDHNIVSQTMGPANQTIPYKQWTAWLNKMEDAGYSLYQTEWHHKEFIEKSDAQNESIFSFTLHVEHPESKLRMIADGRFRVVWKAEKSADGMFVPDTIEITEMSLLQRQGEPLFSRLGVFDIPPMKRGPVLAYDLNKDGYAEILMPATNQIAWNEGGNGYRLDSLNPIPIANCRSAVLGDFDMDGTTDLLIDGSILEPLSTSPQVGMFIFKGDREGTFATGPKPLVIEPRFNVQSDTTLTCGDIDGDGDLDVWLGQYKEPYVNGNMPTPFFNSNDGHPSYLLVNEGDGIHFKERTREQGITEKQFRRVYSSSFYDYDNDGDLDLLNICDFSGVDLHRNDGEGNFKDVTAEAIDVRFLFGMAHSFADFNYDGLLDMYTIGMSSTTASRLHKMGAKPGDMEDLTNMRIPMTFGNRLYYAQPDGTFDQPERAAEVARTGWSWGVVTVDFDNDGDIDFYVANGHDSNTTARDYCTAYWTDDIYRGSSIENPLYDDYFDEKLSYKESHGISWNGFEHNFLFMPMPDGKVHNVSFLAGVALEHDSRIVIADDVNMDGKLDLIIDSNPPDWNAMTDGNNLEVYLNRIPDTGNFIGVRLVDQEGAPLSTAAKIIVAHGGKIQAAANLNGDSFESQHAAIRHFGIGDSEEVDYIEVTWLDGSKKRVEDPAINQYHLIDF